MSEIERIALNDYLITRLANLKGMYQMAAEEAEKERAKEIAKGWKEWSSLDDESKQFILDYLNI